MTRMSITNTRCKFRWREMTRPGDEGALPWRRWHLSRASENRLVMVTRVEKTFRGREQLEQSHKVRTHTSPVHRYIRHSVSLGIQCRVFTSQEVFLPPQQLEKPRSWAILPGSWFSGCLPELALLGKMRPVGMGICRSRTPGSATSRSH